jgi:hypothetical protein
MLYKYKINQVPQLHGENNINKMRDRCIPLHAAFFKFLTKLNIFSVQFLYIKTEIEI